MEVFLKEKFASLHGATVERAIALIEPAEERRKDCRYAVETAVIDLGYISGRERKPPFKARKRASQSLAGALLRVEHLLKSDALPLDVSLYFPAKEIREWRVRLEMEARARAPVKPAQNAAGTIASSKPSRKAAAEKHRAVTTALSLMSYSDAPNTTKGRRFSKLASLLLGKPKENLIKQCKAARQGRSPKWGWK